MSDQKKSQTLKKIKTESNLEYIGLFFGIDFEFSESSWYNGSPAMLYAIVTDRSYISWRDAFAVAEELKKDKDFLVKYDIENIIVYPIRYKRKEKKYGKTFENLLDEVKETKDEVAKTFD